MSPPNNRGRAITKVNALTYAQLVKYLLEERHSCIELADLTGLHYVTVLDYTRAMYRAGALHIGAWGIDKRGRATLKIYYVGRGKDAKRQQLPGAIRSAKHRAKVKERSVYGQA